MNIMKSCEYCSIEFAAPQKEVNRGNGRFCSTACSAKRTRKKTQKVLNCICAQCGKACWKPFSKIKNSRSGLFFCNRLCKETAQKLGGIKAIMPPHYGTSNGCHSYRELAFNNLVAKCERCDYSKYVGVLEVHHIDGDRTHNSLENLRILCPTCHEEQHYLTSTGKYRKQKLGV